MNREKKLTVALLKEKLEKLSGKKVVFKTSIEEASPKSRVAYFTLSDQGKKMANLMIQFDKLLKEFEIEDSFEVSEDDMDCQSTYGMAQKCKEILIDYKNKISKQEFEDITTGDNSYSVLKLYIRQGLIFQLTI